MRSFQKPHKNKKYAQREEEKSIKKSKDILKQIFLEVKEIRATNKAFKKNTVKLYKMKNKTRNNRYQ